VIVPLPLVGAKGGHKSVQFSSEITRNMYIDQVNDRWGMHDFPGLKSLGEESGKDRGWHRMSDTLYKLCGTTLYKVSSNGVYTSRGTVSGSDRAVFADDGTNLFFTANGQLWHYDGSTVSTISQGVVTNPKSIAYINRTFFITGDGGLFGASDVADGTTYFALNYGEAEALPDGLLRVYSFSQLLYMMGSESIETHVHTGTGNPPTQRQDNALINVGLAGTHAVCNTDSYLYWLGDDRKVYQGVGASARSIQSTPVANALESFSDVSDCIASRFVLNGQDFVLFAFPSADATLLYSEKWNYWVDLAAGTQITNPERWYGNAVINCYDKNLVADWRSGNVYELDPDTYTDNGDARLRIRTLPNITAQSIKREKGCVTASRLTIDMEVGVGLASGQGSTPELMCQFSPDGGRTWQAQQHVEFGVMGDYDKRVDFWDFSTGYKVKARIMCSDPVYLSLFDAEAEVEFAGW